MASFESVLPALSGRDDSIEFILLGTGTSSTLPHVDCLTAPPGAKPCRSCLASITPEGRKNKRVRPSHALSNFYAVLTGSDAAVRAIPLPCSASADGTASLSEYDYNSRPNMPRSVSVFPARVTDDRRLVPT